MAKHKIERSYFNDGYVIRVGGKKGPFWAPAGSPKGSQALFETRAKAEKFIGEGRMIEVIEIRMSEANAACGWVEEEGYSDANIARFKAWCGAEGVHYYAAPREDFFPSFGIRDAQKLGLSKIVMEDLS